MARNILQEELTEKKSSIIQFGISVLEELEDSCVQKFLLTLKDSCPLMETLFVLLFPHGVQGAGHFLIRTGFAKFFEKVFPHTTLSLVAAILFRLPLVREVLLAIGCIDASRHNADKVFKKGFVKLAIEHQAALVPMYIFGESKLYNTIVLPRLMPFQNWLVKNLRIALRFTMADT
jgi:hypothetical protein